MSTQKNLEDYTLYGSIYIQITEWKTDLWLLEVKDGVREVSGYKRARGGIFVVMEIFYILTLSTSIFWSCHCTMVLQDFTIRETGQGT